MSKKHEKIQNIQINGKFKYFHVHFRWKRFCRFESAEVLLKYFFFHFRSVKKLLSNFSTQLLVLCNKKMIFFAHLQFLVL